MHLAGVGGYVIEGVLGVHCASAEAEGEGGGIEEMRGTHLFRNREGRQRDRAGECKGGTKL